MRAVTVPWASAAVLCRIAIPQNRVQECCGALLFHRAVFKRVWLVLLYGAIATCGALLLCLLFLFVFRRNVRLRCSALRVRYA